MVSETEFQVSNCLIDNFIIGYNANNELTYWLVLNFGGKSHQGFGGLIFNPKEPKLKEFLDGIFEVTGSSDSLSLNGIPVRVYHNKTKISKLGNYMLETWFNIDTFKVEKEAEDTEEDSSDKKLKANSGSLST
jgi:hypothetical protein